MARAIEDAIKLMNNIGVECGELMGLIKYDTKVGRIALNDYEVSLERSEGFEKVNVAIKRGAETLHLQGKIKDRECGVVCGASYALQHDKDFRYFLTLQRKIRGVKTLLVCRCDKSNPNICHSAGDDQVPCCYCPLSNWPDLCMVIKAFNGCVAVAISYKCCLTSRRHKEFTTVQSAILDEKDKLSSPLNTY